jgi:hypothetical protein
MESTKESNIRLERGSYTEDEVLETKYACMSFRGCAPATGINVLIVVSSRSMGSCQSLLESYALLHDFELGSFERWRKYI